jgi:hypothetical protein
VALDDLAASEVERRHCEAAAARANAEAAAEATSSELAAMTAERNESTQKLVSCMNKCEQVRQMPRICGLELRGEKS